MENDIRINWDQEKENINSTIRHMRSEDKESVFEMMRVFYASPAVLTNGSDEIFYADVDACIAGSPYVEGYVFESDGEICGYAMLAKSYSTEFGKPCIWIEDLYLRDACRGKGLGSRFIEQVSRAYPGALLRLEVEEENERAIRVYKKAGFDFLPYMEMKKHT